MYKFHHFCLICNNQPKKLIKRQIQEPCKFLNLSLISFQRLMPSKYSKTLSANKNFSQRNKVFKRDAVLKTNHKIKREKTKMTKQKNAKQKIELVLLSERKTLEQLYSRGPASLGSSERLQNHSKLSAKIKYYFDVKRSFTRFEGKLQKKTDRG